MLPQADNSPTRSGEPVDDEMIPLRVCAAGRLRQVCDRWIYTACLGFGLDLDEQARSGFHYAYSADQAEYSRNLLFKVGGQMDRVFNTLVDRTRSRLDVPTPGPCSAPRHDPTTTARPDRPRWQS